MGPHIGSNYMKLNINATSNCNTIQNSNLFTNKVDTSFSTQNRIGRCSQTKRGPSLFSTVYKNWSHLTQNSLWRQENRSCRSGSNMAANMPLKFGFLAPAAIFLGIFKVLEASAPVFMKVSKSSLTYGRSVVGNPDFQNGLFYLVKSRVANCSPNRATSVANLLGIFNHMLCQVVWALVHLWGLTPHLIRKLSLSVTAC